MNEADKKVAIVKIIQKKLLGKKLSYREIFSLMDEIAHERLSDILTTYFVAASFKEGFDPQELYYFTKAMVETGNRLHFKGIVADKHSTGGVSGTRATMVVVPIVAAAGFKIPKISSRAITTPAGPADVMEVLAKVEFKTGELEDIVNVVGGCIAWNGRLGIAPADDIIIRVEEPLSFESFDNIIVSIMAKKVAASTTHLVLDIPIGKTMKIRHEKDAERVLRKFKTIGKKFGMRVVGTVTKTFEPAGNGVGPVLEACDVLKVLEQRDDRPMALEERALRLAGELLTICYEDSHMKKDGYSEAKRILGTKQALKKFREIIHAQGGDPAVTSHSLKPKALKLNIISRVSGRLKEVQNYNLNSIAKLLGAPADKHAGVYLHKKIGDKIGKDENIITLYSNSRYNLKEAEHTLKMFPVYLIE
jgi:AMP phosphorylase